MDAAALSESLRTGEGTYLWCRRGLVLTSFAAALCMQLIGLYQMGVIRHLPEPPLPMLNADKVDAAREAYSPMGLPMPDAFLGLVSYAITAALAVIAGPDRWRTWLWWLPVLLAIKVLADAGQAVRLSWQQWAVHRAFCSWCLLAATATLIAVPLAVPEAWAALRYLLGRSQS